MNREIKFRGKTKEHFGDTEGNGVIQKGTWIYGGITFDTDRVWIDTKYFGEILVDKNIIGQFTGLHDKNGKEIYEGDIVYCQTKFGKAKAIIKFIDGKFVAYWDSILTHPQNGHCIACYEINKRFEVIGNIYEDSELLGGE